MHSHKRSIAKTFTWRVLATVTTMSIVFFMTGNLVLAGSIGVFDTIIKLVVYYLHERAWEATRWEVN